MNTKEIKIKYEGTKPASITPEMAKGLIEYAVGILKLMQKADPKNEDCWTACGIDIDGVSPDFTFGSVEDFDGAEDHYDILISYGSIVTIRGDQKFGLPIYESAEN